MGTEVKQLIDEYILVCFDIPQKEGKLRKLILRRIHDIGGIMHTSSVYLMPYSEKAMDLANEISTAGDVVVWRSKQEHPEIAKSITMKYEEHLHMRCVVIEQRLVIIADHIANDRLGKANRMAQKTKKLLWQLKLIATNYETGWLPKEITALEKSLTEVYNKP